MTDPTTEVATAQVGIIMGSDSDLRVMQAAADMLGQLDVPFEMTIVSAHRTPERMMNPPSSERENPEMASSSVQLLNAPRFSVAASEWISAVAASQGINLLSNGGKSKESVTVWPSASRATTP